MPGPPAAKRRRTTGQSEDGILDGLQAENLSLLLQLLQKDGELEVLRQQLRVKDNVIEELQQKAYPTHGLPDICLDRILSFCNIRDVIQGCLTVSKYWKMASETNLKNRNVLKIVRIGIKDAEDQCVNTLVVGKKENKERIFGRLMHFMGSISKLFIDSDRQLSADLILHFAPGLKRLSTTHELPHRTGVVFERLTRVECWTLTAEAVTACPRLRVLVYNSLLCSLATDECHLLPIFSAIRGLTEFCAKHNRFRHMHSLGDDVDAAVEVLVSQNPGLKKFELKDFSATDKSLVSLSRLQNLSSICVTRYGMPVALSEQAIAGLLKGASGKKLRTLSIGYVRYTGEHKEDDESDPVSFHADFSTSKPHPVHDHDS